MDKFNEELSQFWNMARNCREAWGQALHRSKDYVLRAAIARKEQRWDAEAEARTRADMELSKANHSKGMAERAEEFMSTPPVYSDWHRTEVRFQVVSVTEDTEVPYQYLQGEKLTENGWVSIPGQNGQCMQDAIIALMGCRKGAADGIAGRAA